MYQNHVSIHSNRIHFQSSRLMYPHLEIRTGITQRQRSIQQLNKSSVVGRVCPKSITFPFGDVQLSARKCYEHERTWMRIQELNFTGLFFFNNQMLPDHLQQENQSHKRSARQWTAVLLIAHSMRNRKKSLKVCLLFSFVWYLVEFVVLLWFVFLSKK